MFYRVVGWAKTYIPWTILILASIIIYQGITIKQQAHEYTLLTAENQLALGKLIQQHHALEEASIAEPCTPRMF